MRRRTGSAKDRALGKTDEVTTKVLVAVSDKLWQYFLQVCVFVCMRACVRACVRLYQTVLFS
jgi:hypothetical protein